MTERQGIMIGIVPVTTEPHQETHHYFCYVLFLEVQPTLKKKRRKQHILRGWYVRICGGIFFNQQKGNTKGNNLENEQSVHRRESHVDLEVYEEVIKLTNHLMNAN